MTKEEATKLYEGKFFYQIVKPTSEYGDITLAGPFDNIYYIEKSAANHVGKLFSTDAAPTPEYKFVQVVDGVPVQAFTESEILVTDRVL